METEYSALAVSADSNAVLQALSATTAPLAQLNPHLRQKLHDLSNCLTSLIGNLELVEMSTEDPELDLASLELALHAAREALRSVRDLKNDCGC